MNRRRLIKVSLLVIVIIIIIIIVTMIKSGKKVEYTSTDDDNIGTDMSIIEEIIDDDKVDIKVVKIYEDEYDDLDDWYIADRDEEINGDSGREIRELADKIETDGYTKGAEAVSDKIEREIEYANLIYSRLYDIGDMISSTIFMIGLDEWDMMIGADPGNIYYGAYWIKPFDDINIDDIINNENVLDEINRMYNLTLDGQTTDKVKFIYEVRLKDIEVLNDLEVDWKLISAVLENKGFKYAGISSEFLEYKRITDNMVINIRYNEKGVMELLIESELNWVAGDFEWVEVE